MTLAEAIQQAQQGSGKVEVIFKREAIGDLNYLFGMVRNGIIELDPGDEMALMAVAQTGDWEGDHNRTVTITLTNKFDEEWFVGRMRRAVESISAV